MGRYGEDSLRSRDHLPECTPGNRISIGLKGIHRASVPNEQYRHFAHFSYPFAKRRKSYLQDHGRFIVPRWANCYGAGSFRYFLGALDLSRRSEEHTSELQSLMRISYAVFCLKKKTIQQIT